MVTVVLRPLLLSRLAAVVFAVVPGYLIVDGAARGNGLEVVAGVLLAAPIGYFVARAYLARVVCSADAVVIHGYLRTRRIPRPAIVGLQRSMWPRLRWRDPSGAPRSTLVSPFAPGSVAAPFVAAHNERSLARLARCIDEGEHPPARQ